MWFSLVLRLLAPGAEQYAQIVQEEATRGGVDPLLVAAVIYKESRFKGDKCFRGSHGLMQIQLKPRSCKGSMAEAKRLGLYDPRKNVRRGVELMVWWRGWWVRHHSLAGYHWLLHYNQGFGTCRDGGHGCKPSRRIPITTGAVGDYASRVLKIYRKLRRIKRRLPAQPPSGALREAARWLVSLRSPCTPFCRCRSTRTPSQPPQIPSCSGC
jgi:hypothetical protein